MGCLWLVCRLLDAPRPQGEHEEETEQRLVALG